MIACNMGGNSTASPVMPTLAPSNTPIALTETPEPTATLEPTSAEPISFPDAQNYQWVEVFTGLSAPVGVVNAGDGSGRLFIMEKVGMILIVKDGQLLETPFLDISDHVGSRASEQGLLGLAFHPNYSENGFFYVHYNTQNGNTMIARFKVTENPDLASAASELQLLTVQQPFPNHKGGEIVFGPDGYLYIGLGDGGSGGDPYRNGQSTNTLLGKILRIDVNGNNGNTPYVIPEDNPFADGGGEPEIWAYGLRNPWRFSFDSTTGDLYIADVGQGNWEEIDYLAAGSAGGANFGWNIMEGTHPYAGSDSPGFVAPVAEYDHSAGGCSVTGGYVYRGKALPEWNGIYFYGDYCSGKIWGLLNTPSGWQSTELFATDQRISSFGVDESGEIYLVGYRGSIFRLEKQ
jgi:glucose/arabinose dehydrogenase